MGGPRQETRQSKASGAGHSRETVPQPGLRGKVRAEPSESHKRIYDLQRKKPLQSNSAQQKAEEDQ